MKPRLTVACGLVVLITVVLFAIQPTLVLGQPVGPNKVYLPLVRMPQLRAVPALSTPESQTVTPGSNTSYDVTLTNVGNGPDSFFWEIIRDPAQPEGVGAIFVNRRGFLRPGEQLVISITVPTSQTAPLGVYQQTLRVRAGSTDNPEYVDTILETILKPGQTGAPTDIQNGDFEAGHTGWDEYTDERDYTLIEQSRNAHSGQWQASLLGAPNDQSTLRQELTLQQDRLTISFWYKIDSNAPQCDIVRDPNTGLFLADYVVFSAYASFYPIPEDQRIQTQWPLCRDTDTDDQWVRKTVDVSRFAQYPVNLQFFAINDANGTSYFYVDDVELVAAP